MMVLPTFLKRGASEFDLGAARFMANLSSLAYNEREKAFPELVAQGAKEATFFSKNGTHCILVDFGAFRVVVFRGTEAHGTKDILASLKFFKRRLHKETPEIKGAKVHGGFITALDQIWHDLYPKIASQNTPLYITGHGLGGALAVLLAGARISCEARSPVKDNLAAVYSFGCPRVGNNAFAKFMDHGIDQEQGINHHRIVNCTDIVTLLPLLSLRYRHSGNLHYINSIGKINIGISLSEQLRDQAFSAINSLWDGDGLKGWLPWHLFAAHSIALYCRRLDES